MSFRSRPAASPILLSLPVVVLAFSCAGQKIPERDFRADMRAFVMKIGETARKGDPDFILIPQNGEGLFSLSNSPGGPSADDYMAAVQGSGREDLFYGYPEDGVLTEDAVRENWLGYLDMAKKAGIRGLSIDYVVSEAQADEAIANAQTEDLLPFATFRRGLDAFPSYPPSAPGENADDIGDLGAAANFGYLIDPSGFPDKASYLDGLRQSPYDTLIIDLFDSAGFSLTKSEVESLKAKPQGGKRLVVSYMSVGEAETYRFYWESGWKTGNPDWLYEENPDWEGNYKVFYWDPEWQELIVGSGGYLEKILAAGFDGAYLDIIDGYEYFEELTEE